MSNSKPQFTLYSHGSGPNGWKVAIVLNKLGLTYETKFLNFQAQEQKAPEFTKLNPNGRIPAIVDHGNNDFTLWESLAIIEYLVARYDPEHQISADPKNEKQRFEELQWLAFQVSGQGPYFGQLAWFSFYHPEKLPSVLERYEKEIKRVTGVLDGVLKDRKFLLGTDHPTVADFSFITWNAGIGSFLLSGWEVSKEYPNWGRWHTALMEDPAVKKAFADRAEATSG